MNQIVIMDYLEAIAAFHPDAQVVCIGDPTVYENIVWEQGEPVPTQAVLDATILAQAKTDKIQALSDACQGIITSGFQSSALGYPCIYDSQDVDQINIIGSVTAISPTPDSPAGYSMYYANRPIVNGVTQPKVYTIHTYAQLRQAMTDGAQYKLSCLIKFNTKRDFVNTYCSTFAEIIAVTWDSTDTPPP